MVSLSHTLRTAINSYNSHIIMYHIYMSEPLIGSLINLNMFRNWICGISCSHVAKSGHKWSYMRMYKSALPDDPDPFISLLLIVLCGLV